MGQIVVVVVGNGIVAGAAALPMRCQFENAIKNSKSRESGQWKVRACQTGEHFIYSVTRGVEGGSATGKGVRGVANASLTNATRRCVCCMRVSVCVCIYNKAKQRTGRKAERWGAREGGRDGAMGAEPAAVAAVVDCQIHVAFHAFQLSCS